MQFLKNILVGFIISFIGSFPLGYLNIVGFQIYVDFGFEQVITFITGIISIELFIIYFTLIFAFRLSENKKLIKLIESFSIAFMFLLAIIFYSSATSKVDHSTTSLNFSKGFFLSGLLLSCLNFMQVPFWTGWNIWLLNKKYIYLSNGKKYFYILGTIIGTFCGMLGLILLLYFFAAKIDFLNKYLMRIIVPLIFIFFGTFQLITFYRKYYR